MHLCHLSLKPLLCCWQGIWASVILWMVITFVFVLQKWWIWHEQSLILNDWTDLFLLDRESLHTAEAIQRFNPQIKCDSSTFRMELYYHVSQFAFLSSCSSFSQKQIVCFVTSELQYVCIVALMQIGKAQQIGECHNNAQCCQSR